MPLSCFYDDRQCRLSLLLEELTNWVSTMEWAFPVINLETDHDIVLVTSCSLAALSTGLAVLFFYKNVHLRRQQQLTRALWRSDNVKLLDKLEALTLKLDEQRQELDLMKQTALAQEEAAVKDKAQMELEATQMVLGKEEECRKLQEMVDKLTIQQKANGISMEQLSSQLKFLQEGHNDHFCQLLEEKLLTSRLGDSLFQLEVRNKELSEANEQLTKQIEELQGTIKANAEKAETIIGKVSAERDERFNVLQEENDVIKATVMNMLHQAQTKYQDDKALLKWELQRKEQEVLLLRGDLRKVNASLAQLQRQHSQKASAMSASSGGIKGLRGISLQSKTAWVA
jgi:hypothetical protein